MKLNELAKKVGKSAPYVLTLQKKFGPSRLLFTGHDFSEREKELFQSSEMGASALKELQRYSEISNKVKVRIKQELPSVESALKWSRSIGE